MAEDAQYDVATNKRKYDEESTAPPPRSSGGRKPTGFSSGPIASQSPESAPLYSSVPPPVDFQLAKQTFQDLARNNLHNPAEAKRPRVENGGGYDSSAKGFSSGPTDFGQKPIMSAVSSVTSSYGYPGATRKIEIPNGRVGVIIGRKGETIQNLQFNSGAKIQVTKDNEADPTSQTRAVELSGTPEQIDMAEQLINQTIREAESAGLHVPSQRITGQQGGAERFVMMVPNEKVGLVIGKKGDTIKAIQNATGAKIQVIPLKLPPGDTSTERSLHIEGSSEIIEAVKSFVNDVINGQNPFRNSTGYSQQGSYQAQPPTSWGQQQTGYGCGGYGYNQPGSSYPGQAPQYNMTQPQPEFTGYPTLPTSGGYDYYGQQQQQQAPGGPTVNNAGYGGCNNQRGQQGVYNAQDGYGGYQAQPGYGQPTQQPGGYDQQQGYGSIPGYSNVATNPTPDGQTQTPSYGAQAAQGDGSQAPPSTTMGLQQPSPNPSYMPQGPPAQPAYGYGAQPYATSYGSPPQTQKPGPAGQPAAYGQQSPTAAQGVGGYVQPGGYPPQSQPLPALAGAPSSAYVAAASGYVPLPQHGAPPSYGGQQPAAYNTSYGSGGYSQPPAAVYSGDGNPAAPASQALPPPSGGVAKASPQS